MELADFRLLKVIRYSMTKTFSDILSLTYSSPQSFSSEFQDLDSRLASTGVFEELRNSTPYNALQHAVELSRTDAKAAGMEVHRNAGLMMTTLYALSKKIRPSISESERTHVSDALRKYSMSLREFYKDANGFGNMGVSGAAGLWFSIGKRHHNRFYGVANEIRNVTSGIGYEREMLAVLNELELEYDEFGNAKANIEKVCRFPTLAEKLMPSIRSEYNIDDGWDETDEVSQLKTELSSAYARIRELDTQLEQAAARQPLKIVPKHEDSLIKLAELQRELSEKIGMNRPALDVSLTMDDISRTVGKVLLSELERKPYLEEYELRILEDSSDLKKTLDGTRKDAVLDETATRLMRDYSGSLLKLINSKRYG